MRGTSWLILSMRSTHVVGLLCLVALAAAQFGEDPESEMYNKDGGDEEQGPTERVTVGVLHKPTACSEKVGDGYTVKVNLKLSKVTDGEKIVVLDKEKIIHVGHGHFIVGACTGERRSLRIPASLAFGDEGSKRLKVPPSTDLRAVVEVLDFVEPDPYGDDEHHHHEDEDMDPVANDGEGGAEEEDDSSSPIADDQFFTYVKKVTVEEVEELQKRKNVLVMFYAPWCGHCTSLKPKYAKLASAFAGESTVVEIAAVDATEDSAGAEKYGVEGFPTIILFKKAGKHANYDGERSLSDLVAFLNGETGTERLPNGRLSDQAGTVAELNQPVLEWKGKTKSLNELKASIPDGSYYSRVLEGIEKNGPGYVAKEKARLSKMYQGGHAPIKAEQLDSIQRRINILDVFDDE